MRAAPPINAKPTGERMLKPDPIAVTIIVAAYRVRHETCTRASERDKRGERTTHQVQWRPSRRPAAHTSRP